MSEQVTEPPRSSGPTVPGSRVVLGAVAMTLAHLGLRAWAIYGSWFQGDDFAFISRLSTQGLTTDTLFGLYGGAHLMPAGMAISWLDNVLAPFAWWLPATWLFGMQVLATVGVLRLLVTLFGWRPGILPGYAVYLFTVVTVPIDVWWAAGINQLPMLIVLGWGTSAHVHYLRTRRVRHLVAALAWVAAGLLFYEKCVLALALYGLVTVCWFSRGTLLARLATAIARYPLAALAYLLAGAGYLAAYAAARSGTRSGDFRHLDLARSAGNMVLRGWLSSTWGGPWQWDRGNPPESLPLPSDGLVLVCLLGTMVLLVEMHRCRRKWGRATALPLVFLTADLALILVGRISAVGPQAALALRYISELSLITGLALTAAVLPVRGATEPVEIRRRSEFLDHPARVAVVVTLVSVLGVWNTVDYVRAWHADQADEQYATRLIDELRSARSPVPLVDTPVLPDMIWPPPPENLVSHAFRPVTTGHATFPTVATDHLEVVGTDGRIRPVVLDVVRRNVRGPVKRCGYRVGTHPTRVRFDGPIALGEWWVRMGYIASQDAVTTVTVGSARHRVPIKAGLHAVYFTATGRDYGTLTVHGLPRGATLCTNDVQLGTPITIPPPPTAGGQR